MSRGRTNHAEKACVRERKKTTRRKGTKVKVRKEFAKADPCAFGYSKIGETRAESNETAQRSAIDSLEFSVLDRFRFDRLTRLSSRQLRCMVYKQVLARCRLTDKLGG